MNKNTRAELLTMSGFLFCGSAQFQISCVLASKMFGTVYDGFRQQLIMGWKRLPSISKVSHTGYLVVPVSEAEFDLHRVSLMSPTITSCSPHLNSYLGDLSKLFVETITSL